MRTGALLLFGKTSTSSTVSFLYADYALLSISKNARHPLPFLCRLTAVKLGEYIWKSLQISYLTFVHWDKKSHMELWYNHSMGSIVEWPFVSIGPETYHLILHPAVLDIKFSFNSRNRRWKKWSDKIDFQRSKTWTHLQNEKWRNISLKYVLSS